MISTIKYNRMGEDTIRYPEIWEIVDKLNEIINYLNEEDRGKK